MKNFFYYCFFNGFPVLNTCWYIISTFLRVVVHNIGGSMNFLEHSVAVFITLCCVAREKGRKNENNKKWKKYPMNIHKKHNLFTLIFFSLDLDDIMTF